VKEVQLSPRIDPHDLGIKVQHAVNFLCEDMKVKVALKFRGREMAHTEIGFEVINKFIAEIAPFGHPDFTPKLVGRAINLMVSPLPRNKRAKNPRHEVEELHEADDVEDLPKKAHNEKPSAQSAPEKVKVPVSDQPPAGGLQNPFANLEIN
jgi:translation initiation factor IF-3